MYDPNANQNQDPMNQSGQSQSQAGGWGASGQSGQAMDPTSAYNNLDPNQRTQVAQTFIRGLSNSNDPQAQQYASMDPSQVTPDQLAQMHQYSAQNSPQTLNDVMQHPALANSGMDTSQQMNQSQNSGWGSSQQTDQSQGGGWGNDPSQQNTGNTGY